MSSLSAVLSHLERNRGVYLSGEAIAATLQISRSAVWKSINTLRAQGYAIEAVPRLGYRLEADSDILSAEAIRSFLPDSMQDIPLFVAEKCSSTNQLAKRSALDGVSHGAAFLSDSQDSGRGRYGRSFFSPSETGLYLSIVLDPGRYCFPGTAMITSFAAVAVCEAIEALCPCRLRVKWVNDILLSEKKIAGILTEGISDLETGRLSAIVLGIGINVYPPKGGFPPELANTAGWLSDTPIPGGRNHLAAQILTRLAAPSDASLTDFLPRYRQRLAMLGSDIEVMSTTEHYFATALDVDAEAGLVVRRQDGSLATLRSGEIRVRAV